MGFSERGWGGAGGALGFSGGILVAAVVPPDVLVCSVVSNFNNNLAA